MYAPLLYHLPLQAFLVRDTSQLDPLLAEHESLMRQATDLMDHYLWLKRRNREIKPQKVGGCQIESS